MPDAPGNGSPGPDPTGGRPVEPPRRQGEADAWAAFSYVLSGMLFWGGVGWLLSVWLGARALIGLGLMVGTAGGLGLVWLRYGRQQ